MSERETATDEKVIGLPYAGNNVSGAQNRLKLKVRPSHRYTKNKYTGYRLVRGTWDWNKSTL